MNEIISATSLSLDVVVLAEDLLGSEASKERLQNQYASATYIR
jgi:hypothetical protein